MIGYSATLARPDQWARAPRRNTRRPYEAFSDDASIFFEVGRRRTPAPGLLGDAAVFLFTQPVQRLLVDDAAVEHVDLAIRILGVARVVRDDSDRRAVGV
jgi:hypothetical protein